MTLLFHPEAMDEFERSTLWYRKRSSEAALRFEEEVFAMLDRVIVMPRAFPMDADGHHKAVLEVFPFAIVFYEESDAVYVIAVAHGKRQEGFWKRRRFRETVAAPPRYPRS